MSVKQNVPYQKLVKVATPAVGTDFVLTGPGQGLWRVISIAYRLVASAVVATRSPTLVADDGTDVFFRVSSNGQQSASQTIDYGAFAGGASGGIAFVTGLMPLPTDGLWLEPGWRLRSSTSGIDVGDQYSAIAAVVEEFPNGPRSEWQPTVDRSEYERS